MSFPGKTLTSGDCSHQKVTCLSKIEKKKNWDNALIYFSNSFAHQKNKSMELIGYGSVTLLAGKPSSHMEIVSVNRGRIHNSKSVIKAS